MRERKSILQILKSITLIPLLIVLAIIVAICAIVKKGEIDIKAGGKIIKRRIEILLRKNPALISNINKINQSIYSSLEKAYDGTEKYIEKIYVTNDDIELDLNDDVNSDNIKLNIYSFKINGKKILKDCTGYNNIDEFMESLGYKNYNIDDFEKEERRNESIVKISNTIKEIIEAVKLVDSCMKEQYKGSIKLYYDVDIDDYYLENTIHNDSYVILKINGNINNLYLSAEFKEKIKSLSTKIKL